MISAILVAMMARDLPKAPLKLVGGVATNGTPVNFAPGKSKATVLFFIATDCPIANRYAPEIARIDKAYSAKGVKTYRIYTTKDAKAIIQHGNEYSLSMTAVLDSNRSLMAATGAKISPEAIVLNQKGVLVYRGRIDDQNVEHGVVRKGYRRDLRVALDELLAGKPISQPEMTAIGCYL